MVLDSAEKLATHYIGQHPVRNTAVDGALAEASVTGQEAVGSEAMMPDPIQVTKPAKSK